MEHGFFHPDLGYWQTISEPSAELVATYPAGTVQVPLKPAEGYAWNGVQWMPPEPVPPTREQQVADIEARRDAALAAGVEHDGTLYHADSTFLTEMLGRVMGYQVGVYVGPQPVRTKRNTIVMLDQVQHVALAAAVGAHRQAVYAQSWAEKDAL